jgi:diadenosine tetraphosphatase ApaH/serine/threonine PP2A family protein phosphatase
MKYGILGDIHANLSALQCVFSALDGAGVHAVVSVGDVVGYGAAPGECIDLLLDRDVRAVMGNHDAACLGRLDTRYFNNYARAAVEWTKGVLSPRHAAWLNRLPLALHLEHCSIAHGTLHRPEVFDYIQSPTDADPSLDVMPFGLCFVGHSHVPVTLLRLRHDPQRTAYTSDTEIDIDEACRALVNVGSVGQPRDEDSRAAFAVYDSASGRAWIRRVEYDIDREADRIRRAGLPDMLAMRLHLGV